MAASCRPRRSPPSANEHGVSCVLEHAKHGGATEMVLSPEQEQIRDMLRDFAREQLAPKAAEWDRTCHFPREELRALGDLGVCGMVVPEEWGGAGLDYVSLALALEEIAAGDGAVSTIISVQKSVVCGPINAFGKDAQKAQYLKKL